MSETAKRFSTDYVRTCGQGAFAVAWALSSIDMIFPLKYIRDDGSGFIVLLFAHVVQALVSSALAGIFLTLSTLLPVFVPLLAYSILIANRQGKISPSDYFELHFARGAWGAMAVLCATAALLQVIGWVVDRNLSWPFLLWRYIRAAV